MGETKPNYSDEIVRELAHRLALKFNNLHVGKVYYQGILQPNEQRVWNSVARRVKWDELRKFLLFGFGDAAGLESGKEEADSVYTLAQIEIARALYRAAIALDAGAPIVLLAHSLGGQVFSCYMWDARKAASGKSLAPGCVSRLEPRRTRENATRRLKIPMHNAVATRYPHYDILSPWP